MNQDDHSMDGQDPDAPQNRHRRSLWYPEASHLVDDFEELKLLSEADVRHYTGKA
jgi:hypothetical protein